jgi:hypothetical protein
MMHLRYARYVLRHKWFVLLAAIRLRIPWLGLVHDLSKFSRAEWGPYARFFHGQTAHSRRDGVGYYKPGDTGDPAFEAAWLHHVQCTKHHWQSYAIVTPEGGISLHPMPDRYRREMLADWQGASRAQGAASVKEWYARHHDKLHLHPETREWIEWQLGGRVTLRDEPAELSVVHEVEG